jgi:GR25 family glycosyltransferase involved in LPS biosynthesis
MSVKRKSFMEAQLQLYPELDYFFHDAFDARFLSQEELNLYYDDKKATKVLKRSMVNGEIGVAKSQLKAMEEISKDSEFGLIMEDDILISPFFSSSLNSSIAFVKSKKPRIVLFTAIPEYSKIAPIEIDKSQGRVLYKAWGDPCYAACYLINKAACELILGQGHKVFNVIDNWGYLMKNFNIEIRAVVPHVVAFSKHGIQGSTINFDDKRDQEILNLVNKFPIWKRIIIKVKRFYNKKRYRLVKNKENVWYNNLNIIQSKF